MGNLTYPEISMFTQIAVEVCKFGKYMDVVFEGRCNYICSLLTRMTSYGGKKDCKGIWGR